MEHRKVARISLLIVFCCTLTWSIEGRAQSSAEVAFDVGHAVSQPVRDMAPDLFATVEQHVVPLGRPNTEAPSAHQPDPVLQTSAGPLVSSTSILNFLGVGVGITSSFSDCCAPPDTNGAVGTTQFVQWVNLDFAVFDKTTGALVSGPTAGNTLWSALGGQCSAHNDGDPIAQYDKAANRWVLAQPVFEKPYTYCIAVSKTSDATGAYNLYAFSLPKSYFPDYPKLGVWPDAYYASFNIFSGNLFKGARACAFNRSAMLAGSSATQVCFQLSSSFASLLPADLDGATAPPSGAPNTYINFGTNSLNLWKFHVDFVHTANSTFTGPTNLSVAAFSEACGGGSCIPQLNSSQQLDSLGDRLMYRFAYRNFGTYESFLVNHSITAGSSVGVRWYELRKTPPGSATAVFQQGTFAPDSAYRWMGSIAQDKLGDIALGYSKSSSSIYPAIWYTGRVPSDTAGTMEAEAQIIAGGGSQQPTLSRWGDYSSMAIDPSDDCTFWYTTEYLESSGTFNWSTRIASFKLDSCT